jgi:hypothetical protein
MFLAIRRGSGPNKALILFIFALLPFHQATGDDWNVQGVVTDSEGASISKAHVIIHADRSGRNAVREEEVDSVLETDQAGHFLAQLRPGFYDLCVMANAFTPFCQKLLVDGSTILRPHIQLKPDPQVVRRLGDTF